MLSICPQDNNQTQRNENAGCFADKLSTEISSVLWCKPARLTTLVARSKNGVI